MLFFDCEKRYYLLLKIMKGWNTYRCSYTNTIHLQLPLFLPTTSFLCHFPEDVFRFY